MAYKDLLVHLDDSKGCAKRVEAAVRLAGQHGAHLTGVYPILEIPLLNYIREQIPRDIQARHGCRGKSAGRGRSQGLSGGGRARRRRQKDDHALDTTLANVLSMHARYADLVVLGQVNPDEPPYAGHHLPEEVAGVRAADAGRSVHRSARDARPARHRRVGCEPRGGAGGERCAADSRATSPSWW